VCQPLHVTCCREVIYKIDGVPVVIDTSGKGDFIPTVFALWRVGGMLGFYRVPWCAYGARGVGRGATCRWIRANEVQSLSGVRHD
jgi:hypothetical protein